VQGAFLPSGFATVSVGALTATPPFTYVINSIGAANTPLVNGTRLYVRVAAENDIGFDANAEWVPAQPYANNRAWAYSVPAAASTAYQPPSPPVALSLQLLTGTSMRLVMRPSLYTGGSAVTHYEINVAQTSAFTDKTAKTTKIAVATWAVLDASSPGSSPLLYDLLTLTPGTTYYVRVRAINNVGASAWTLASPALEVPRAKPAAPANVRVTSPTVRADSPISTLDVAWAAPLTANGSPLTGYVVEMWSDRVVYEVQRLSVYNTRGKSDLLCTSTSSCFVQLKYRGSLSVNFPLDESASDVRRHLMATLTEAVTGTYLVPHIEVTRTETVGGYEWDITFSGPARSGSLPGRQAAGLGNVPALVLGDSTALHDTSRNSAGNCGNGNPSSAPYDNSCITLTMSTITNGARRYGRGEVQTVTIIVDDGSTSNTHGPDGWYRLSLASGSGTPVVPDFGLGTSPLWTPYIPVSATAAEVEAIVAQLSGVRGVRVVKEDLSNVDVVVEVDPTTSLPSSLSRINRAAGSGKWDGFQLRFTFPPQDGDITGIVLDATSIVPAAGGNAPGTIVAVASDAANVIDSIGRFVCEGCAIGERPVDYMVVSVSPSVYAVTLQNLTAGRRYYVQVSAQNDRGLGSPSLALCSPATAAYCSPDTVEYANPDPYGIRVPVQAPSAPTLPVVDVDPGMSTQLRVTYAAPKSDGGSPVRSYRVEWSTASDFSTGAVGRQDFECPIAAERHTVSITTSIAGRGIGGGTFYLTVTHGSQTFRTQEIRYDAQASSSEEVPDPALFSLTGSGVFCESAQINSVIPATSPTVPCQVPITNPGSLQSALQALPFVKQGVVVSRTSAPTAGPDEYTWIVTFLDDGGDWDIVPTSVSLIAADDQSSLPNSAVAVSVVTHGVSSASLTGCAGVHVIPGLIQGTPYYVRVYAYNQEGFSPAVPALNPRGQAFQAPMRVPARPTSVALSVKSGSELRVTWSPPTDSGGDVVSSYVVEWGTVLDGTTGALTGGGSATVTYIPDAGPYTKVISGLTMGTRYYVRVKACNSQGCGDGQQSTPTREHPRQLPKSPASVRLEPTSDTMLTVAFAPPTSDGGDAITSYRVDWDTDADFEGLARLPHKGSVTVAAPTPAQGSTVLPPLGYHTITDLRAGQVYYVRVSACNRVGCGGPSFDVPAGKAPRRGVPGKPYDILSDTATNGACRSVSITFTAPVVPHHGLFCAGGSGAPPQPDACPTGMGYGTQADGGMRVTAYEVQYSTSPTFTDADGGSVSVPINVGDNGNPVSFVLGPGVGANLQPGQTYYIRVASRNGVGVGPFCSREGPLCDRLPLFADPSAPC